jgi:hypothetical protein
MRRLLSTILVCEALLIALAIPVAIQVGHTSGAKAGIVGGTAAIVALLLCGVLRFRWGFIAASVLQILVILSGFAVTAMFVLGVIFGALWITAIWLGKSVQTREAR